MNSFTIRLIDVRFDIRIGILPLEQIVSQPVSISLEVSIASKDFETSFPEENLQVSISYAELYRLMEEEMKDGSGLLETLAVRLSRRIQESYPSVLKGVIEITKLNPPIPGMAGKAGIKYFFEKTS
ncbi:MAG: dihydroneopterin aldolase [Bacteroides sp.]|nr:dihydroneopterin aldolase [Bacteroides sp.]